MKNFLFLIFCIILCTACTNDISNSSIISPKSTDIDLISKTLGKEIFDNSYVHKINLYIDYDDWYEKLTYNHISKKDSYTPGILEHEDYSFYPVGIRFKGSSSFTIKSKKKSFKIDVNEFFESCTRYDRMSECDDATFYGLRKLNLNNGFHDPTFLREKIFFETASNYLPTLRTSFAEVYVNDEYMGLYTVVEQPDDLFVAYHYKDSNGNLFECEKNNAQGKGGSFGSDLSFHGYKKENYEPYYIQKIGDDEGWDSLIHLIDVLNNYKGEEFIEEIERIADTDQFLLMLALNSIFANYDSYSGSAHNYYLYEDSKGIFHPIIWDGNEAFGTFRINAPDDIISADPTIKSGILEKAFFAHEIYMNRYHEIIEEILINDFNVEEMNQSITKYADMIRDSVYRDNQKVELDSAFEEGLYYSDTEENNITANMVEETTFVKGRAYEVSQQRRSYSLLQFVELRSRSLQQYIKG
jgi:spore coat protein CotH